MKKYIFPAIAVILILICLIIILPAPNPKRCAICDSIPYHAPALVNLATGEVGELAVYEPHPFKVAELNPYQQGGTFSFIYVAGLNGYSDTANCETHITIPIDEMSMRKSTSANPAGNALLAVPRKDSYFWI